MFNSLLTAWLYHMLAYCSQNSFRRFWLAVQDLKCRPLQEVPARAQEIWQEFLAEGAPSAINLDSHSYERTSQNLKDPGRYSFEDAQVNKLSWTFYQFEQFGRKIPTTWFKCWDQKDRRLYRWSRPFCVLGGFFDGRSRPALWGKLCLRRNVFYYLKWWRKKLKASVQKTSV